MSTMPSSPLSHPSIDFHTLPTHEELFLVIDDYSRYPEIHHAGYTSARSAIQSLESISAQHGILGVLQANSGPKFNGLEFETYTKKMGIPFTCAKSPQFRFQ
jgi:hypothetical protein